jgi:hypothetical protein
MTGLPKRPRGRMSAAAEATYTAELQAFCDEILKIKSSLDFAVSSRGWCYILEERIGLGKGDFDQAQDLINDCRKFGLLPINICATDSARAALHIESIDDGSPDEEAADWFATLEEAHNRYTPFSFWEGKEHYLEMWVEKIDLRSLFSPICSMFRVPLSNVRGWNDINCRAASMRRFKQWEARGNKCVLLYCGDHDPGGLAISDAIRSNLRDLSGAVGWEPNKLIVDRFGLNYDFIQANNLSWIDNLETSSGGRLDDPGHKDHHKPYVRDYIRQFGARKVEANALVVRPQEGRRLCEAAIKRYLPENVRGDYEDALEIERLKVKDAIRRLLMEGGL